MTALTRLDRTLSGEPQNVPRPTGTADIVTVETRWGALQPMQPVPGILTVGELEVGELVDNGAQLVDTRVPDSRSGVSLPGAVQCSVLTLSTDGPFCVTRTSIPPGPMVSTTPATRIAPVTSDESPPCVRMAATPPTNEALVPR